MTKPQTKPVEIAASDKYPIRWSPLPANYLAVSNLEVRANRTLKNIKRGETYRLRLVTDKGLLQIVGDIDNLYPMSAFNLPIAAVGEIGIAVDD